MSYYEVQDIDEWDKRPNLNDAKAAKMLAVDLSKSAFGYSVREVSNGTAKTIAIAWDGVLFEPVPAETGELPKEAK